MRINPSDVRRIAMMKTEPNKKEQAKLLESFAKDLKEVVKKNVASGIYGGEEYCELRKFYQAKVGPDRQKAIKQFNWQFSILPKRTKGDYFAKLLGLPFRGCINAGPTKTTAFIYNEAGEQIAFYDSWQGWSKVSTEEERVFGRAMTRIYSQMYDEAKAELAENQVPSGQVDIRIWGVLGKWKKGEMAYGYKWNFKYAI